MARSWKRRGRARVVGVGSALSPQDLVELYGLADLHARGVFGQGLRIGFVEFARPSESDDRAFWARYSVKPELNRPVRTVPVGVPAGDPGALGETDLDLQYAGALAPGAELIAYLIDDQGTDAAFMGRLYDAVLAAAADGCQILSISLGTGDAMAAAAGPISSGDGGSWNDPASYAAALDEAIAGAGMLVVAAAGDSGLYGGFPLGQSTPQAVWPASQGAIVAVGGTQLAGPGNVGSGAQAWGGQSLDPAAGGYNPANTLPQASGGGGPSCFIPLPAHQAGFGGPWRQTPDVAAFAGPLTIVDLGSEVTVWGTSAGAPIVAAVCALCRQAAGALPTQAQLYGAATDVLAGNNTNDALLLTGLTEFAVAEPGYDACTGAGSVAAPDLLRVMSMG